MKECKHGYYEYEGCRKCLEEEKKAVPFNEVLCGLQVNEEMLIRAVREAVKVGILPSHGVDHDTYLKHWNGIKKILQAALAA